MANPLLGGIRVLDMTQIRAGPKGSRWLADAGAEVIKLEARGRSDSRGFGRRGSGSTAGPIAAVSETAQREGNRVAFEQLNRNKLGLSIDLSFPEGKKIFKNMVSVCDVVMENFSYGVMDRLGLGYNDLRKYRPDLVMMSMPAYGSSGPYRDYVSFGWAQEHMGGITSRTGYWGGPPQKTGTIVADPLNGVHGAIAVLTALIGRAKTGEGRFIDFSQLESMVPLSGEAILDYSVNGRPPQRNGNRDSHLAPQGVYQCAGEDNWVCISVTTDEEWAALCGVLQSPELAADPRFTNRPGRVENHDALDSAIGRWTMVREKNQAMTELQVAGVPAGAVLDQAEAYRDAQAVSRDFLVELTHPDGVTFPYSRTPARFSKTPAEVRTPGPLLGEHNEYLLGTLLGIPAPERERLESSGVTATLFTDLG
ncbi:MAG: CoA transferase [Dehalococcoidia bacterium]|nr:CoA transferase [Dehalococcoidia bacterium]